MSNKPMKYTNKFDNDVKSFFYNKDGKAAFFHKSDFKSENELALFSVFDTNKDRIISNDEISNFLLCIKGGDANNTDFELDDEQFLKFKEQAKISENSNITKNDVISLFKRISKELARSVLVDCIHPLNLTIPKDIEDNISELNSEISFDTTDEKFVAILNAFDTEVNDGKLSKNELENLWTNIKQNCTKNNNAITTFDSQKIEQFINSNIANDDITPDDFISFIDTIDLALKNRNTDSEKIKWKKSKISEPNARIDKKFNQNNIGDCWLSSVLVAYSLTENGRKVLNDSYRKDDKGNIYVRLKGPNETYVITPEELTSKDYKDYANGDGDIRAFEIAVEKYFEERELKDGIIGGYVPASLYLIFGIDARNAKRYDKVTPELLQSIDFSKQVAISADYNHAVAIAGCDDKYVYMINQTGIIWDNDNPSDKDGKYYISKRVDWQKGADNINLSDFSAGVPLDKLKSEIRYIYILDIESDSSKTRPD